MTTTFILKKDKKKYKFITQQYHTGLYVAIYVEGYPIPSQTGSQLKELTYHRNLRKAITKNEDTFVVDESSVLS
jgi:hypothetical protein